MGKEEEQVLQSSKGYAERKGLVLNTNKKILDLVVLGLVKNLKDKGEAYCPCRPLIGDKEEDEKKVCPCFWHLEEIKQDGHCKCRLFFAKEKQQD